MLSKIIILHGLDDDGDEEEETYSHDYDDRM